MDKNVYTNDTVGEFMNKGFISVKMQMDSTRHDNQDVRKWYDAGHEIATQFKINAYPTYLFFSPDGRPVHKDIGSLTVREFLTLATDAMNPQQQFFTLLFQYQQGDRKPEFMRKLATKLEKFHDDSLANIIAGEFMHDYLRKLSSTNLWTKDNLVFISTFCKDLLTEHQLFKRYFKSRVRIDSIMQKAGYADELINSTVYGQDVNPWVNAGIKDGTEPKWSKIERNIQKKYSRTYVSKNLLQGQVSYFWRIKNFQSYAKYRVQQIQNANVEKWPAGDMTSIALNNFAVEVFKYSNDKTDLESALSWVDRALSMQVTPRASEMDTKANILYKLGRKKEGLALEELSYKLAPNDKEILESYEKMKNDQPTW